MLRRIKIIATIRKGSKKDSHSEFYGEYAVVVFRCLRKPIFLKFVNWVLKREEINEEKVNSVQIRMFPSVKNNGNSLIGRCSPQGVIFLYPKRAAICKRIFDKMNPKGFRRYVEGRARASLIHELLHLKYKGNENKVKRLTKKYFTIFHRKQNLEKSSATNYKDMIFNY